MLTQSVDLSHQRSSTVFNRAAKMQLSGTLPNRSQKFFKKEFELLKKLESSEYVLKAMEFT